MGLGFLGLTVSSSVTRGSRASPCWCHAAVAGVCICEVCASSGAAISLKVAPTYRRTFPLLAGCLWSSVTL